MLGTQDASHRLSVRPSVRRILTLDKIVRLILFASRRRVASHHRSS